MGQPKKLRTTERKLEQLKNSIKELCDEAMQIRKKAAQEEWESKNKKNTSPDENASTV